MLPLLGEVAFRPKGFVLIPPRAHSICNEARHEHRPWCEVGAAERISLKHMDSNKLALPLFEGMGANKLALSLFEGEG